MTWMQTFAGKAVDLADPKPETICLDDIAHALSRICRYTGHTRRHYSVAEHCILISRALERDYPDEPALWLSGLLHDAHEAYAGDISSPMHLALGPDVRAEIKRIQHALDMAIREALEIPPGAGVAFHDQRVKMADQRILIDERDSLLGPSPMGPWDIERRGGNALGVTIYAWAAPVARLEFRDRFKHLHAKVGRLPRVEISAEIGQ